MRDEPAHGKPRVGSLAGQVETEYVWAIALLGLDVVLVPLAAISLAHERLGLALALFVAIAGSKVAFVADTARHLRHLAVLGVATARMSPFADPGPGHGHGDRVDLGIGDAVRAELEREVGYRQSPRALRIVVGDVEETADHVARRQRMYMNAVVTLYVVALIVGTFAVMLAFSSLDFRLGHR